MITDKEDIITYTVTAWDIYNLATRKAQRGKENNSPKDVEFWAEVADIIKELTTEFNEMKKLHLKPCLSGEQVNKSRKEVDEAYRLLEKLKRGLIITSHLNK